MHMPLAYAIIAITLAGISPVAAQQTVTRETFIRAETDRMFRDIAALAGDVNQFHIIRSPTPLDM
jgi:hypothetical protein